MRYPADMKRVAVRIATLILFAAAIAACTGVRVPREWEPLLEEARAFEGRIGFTKTGIFSAFSEEQGRVHFCGHVSPLYLPYSYQDPTILWYDVATERECRAHADGADVYFDSVEVLGEAGAAVSPEVLAVQLQRFLYLVFHEDCHEQFNFPYGVEEALCNLIAYRAMVQFSVEKYGPKSREAVAIQRYVNEEDKRARNLRDLYVELAGYYARYDRKQLAAEALLKDRARLFGKAERVLAWKRGSLNNVSLANEMTYSRFYPLVDRVYDKLGRDLVRTVAFFRRVDTIKPSPEQVMKKYRIESKDSLDFIRAYEAEVARSIEAALAGASRS